MADMKSSEGKNTSGSNKTSGGNAGGTDRSFTGAVGPTKASGQAKPSSADKGERSAMGDYLGYGDSFLDTIGNFLAGMLGFSELNPKTNPSSTPGAADRAFDPIGMGLGLAGSLVGVPGLGTAYGALGDLTGGATNDWGKVNLGPSVFGGGGSAPSSQGPSAVGTPSGSVQTMDGRAPREAERGTMRMPGAISRQPAPPDQGEKLNLFRSTLMGQVPNSDLVRAFTGVG
jgi:hypothetical protein